MYRYSQRLDHCAIVVIHLIRKCGNLGFLHCKILAGCTSGLEAHYLQLLTEIIFSMAAGIAFAAYHLRFDGYLLTNFQILYIRADLCNLAGHLMSLSYRITGSGMLSIIYMDIRTAYTDSLNLHKYLIAADLRNRNIVKYDLRGFCLGCRFHHYLLFHCTFHAVFTSFPLKEIFVEDIPPCLLTSVL